eukprot:TRINITY_DN2343_c1_g1_i2.p1 TRINITY_DN2343_c1_g1~~TRINITY_DN2343_c1_g1_i2.p1  ORF type:complete len:1241 (+),score=324.07 TRINITY_DN2343_c1_g1_i2:259-3981(+)
MFLHWISQIGLLEHQKERNVMKAFPLEVRRSIVSTMVQFVRSDIGSAGKSLTTKAHVEYILETIGQAYSLPLDDLSTMQYAFDIYKEWLFGRKLPAAFADDMQLFLQTLILHLSFLFERRDGASPTQVERHTALCIAVLNTFLEAGEKQGDQFSAETWTVLLKVAIAITDLTIRRQRGLEELTPLLLQVLLELYLRAEEQTIHQWSHLQKFYSQYTHSRVAVAQWVVTVYGLSRRVLRILYGPLEGSDSICIRWLNQATTVLKYPDERVFFLWHHILHIMGNVCKIAYPDIFTNAIQGISSVCDEFVSVGTHDPDVQKGQVSPVLPHAPRITTLIEIFGSWLFEASMVRRRGHTRGIALAYSSLCRIFCRLTKEEVKWEHISRFVVSVRAGIEMNADLVTEAILLNSKTLFGTFIPGIRLLLPHFITMVRRVLELAPGRTFPTLHRSAAISLIGSMWGTMNAFMDLPQRQGITEFEDGKNIALSIASSVAPKRELLMDCHMKILMTEPDESNIIQLLWQSAALAHDSIKFGDSLVESYVDVILRRFVYEIISVESCMTALKVLSTIACLSSNGPHVPSSLPVRVVHGLCGLVIRQMAQIRSAKRVSEENEKLLDVCFTCLTDWCVRFNDALVHNQDMLKSVHGVIELCVSSLDTRTKKASLSSKTIQSCALHFLFSLSCFGQVFPLPMGVSRVSAITDEDLIEGERQDGRPEKVCFFALDDHAIVSLVEKPELGGVRLIVRTMAGKFAWDCFPKHGVQSSLDDRLGSGTEVRTVKPRPSNSGDESTERKTKNPMSSRTLVPPPIPKKLSVPSQKYEGEKDGNEDEKGDDLKGGGEKDEDGGEEDEGDSDSIKSDMDGEKEGQEVQEQEDSVAVEEGEEENEVPKDALEEFLMELRSKDEEESVVTLQSMVKRSLMRSRSLRTALAKSMSRWMEKDDKEVRTPMPIPAAHGPSTPERYALSNKLQFARLFASQLGWIDVKNTSNFSRLDATAKLMRSLRILDKHAERECHKIGVVFVGTGQKTEADILQNSRGSERYERFLRNLGWLVDLGQHRGFMGGLDSDLSNGQYAPYFADVEMEVIFHVVTMMPTKFGDPQQIQKKRHVGNDHVHIVWTENPYEYRVKTIRSQFNFVHVIIRPLEEGMYHIRLRKKDDVVSSFGPLQDDMIVRECVLADLVRMTVVNANRCVRSASFGFRKPFDARHQQIMEIIERNAVKDDPFVTYYPSWFAPRARISSAPRSMM